MSGDTLRDAPKANGLASPAARDQLYLVLECDRPLAGGLRCELDAVDEVVIGRAAQRSARRETVGGIPKVIVGVPDRALSATHARLVRAGDEWLVEDLRSTNGSFVNGMRTQKQALRGGDVLELGHTLFVFGGDTLTPAGTPEIVDASAGSTSGTSVPGLATLVPTLAAELAGLARIARSHVPVLLLGETGTGKEVLARAVHDLAMRAGDFVAVNCAALPASLVEGQLFGACRGAFSGAVRDQVGFVRAADRGTLMLDEIGDLSLAAQAALLRVLQEREVVPLGATRPIRVDVRTIAATHRDLGAMVGGGAFRADLLARLDGFTFQVPPLRARKPDIGILIASLLRKMGGDAERVTFETRAARALLLHAWPTNIRGLEQCLGRVKTLADGVITLDHLPAHIVQDTSRMPSTHAASSRVPESPAALRAQLIDELRAASGNVAAVARAFGKSPVQVHRWMKRFGVSPQEFRRASSEPLEEATPNVDS